MHSGEIISPPQSVSLRGRVHRDTSPKTKELAGIISSLNYVYALPKFFNVVSYLPLVVEFFLVFRPVSGVFKII